MGVLIKSIDRYSSCLSWQCQRNNICSSLYLLVFLLFPSSSIYRVYLIRINSPCTWVPLTIFFLNEFKYLLFAEYQKHSNFKKLERTFSNSMVETLLQFKQILSVSSFFLFSSLFLLPQSSFSCPWGDMAVREEDRPGDRRRRLKLFGGCVKEQKGDAHYWVEKGAMVTECGGSVWGIGVQRAKLSLDLIEWLLCSIFSWAEAPPQAEHQWAHFCNALSQA